MSEQAEVGLLATILGEVRAISAKVSSVEVTVTQAVAEIKHTSKMAEDHETRLRALEATSRENDVEATGFVTKADLEKSQDARFRKTSWLVGIALTVLVPVEAALLAVLFRG